MAYQRVARLAELPKGRGLCVRVGGLEVGLYRVGECVYAMANACPHAGYPLHEGELEDRVIYCAGHGWPYDVETGRPPDVEVGEPLPRYPVDVRDDEVWIDVEAPLV